jgi:hypothetical protein
MAFSKSRLNLLRECPNSGKSELDAAFRDILTALRPLATSSAAFYGGSTVGHLVFPPAWLLGNI